jgi:hypothetical protein
MALVAAFAVGDAQAATTTTYQANGTSAMTFACVNNCSSQLFLTLQANQNGGTTSWLVLFGVFGSDSSGNQTSIVGSGQIPASMVSGNGNNNLTLNLDTNAAGLQVQYCVTDQNYNTTCSPFSGGVITVNWQTTALFGQHYTAQNQTKIATLTVHNNTQNDVSSATAQSNAFGTQFSDSFAQLGTAHQGTIEITKQ